MINYLASFAETNGVAFPDTLGKNATGAGATDGTEFVKLFIDDIWGWFQALMDYAGLTPNGVTEAPNTAQRLEALRRGFGGVGEWVIWTKKDIPSVTGDRVIFLNGQGILRANYAELDSKVYVGDPANGTASAFYHADDAAGTTRNTAGVYLILPETRGYALRGLDVVASVDPDGASRDYGSIQLDAFQGWQLGAERDSTGLRDYWGRTSTRDQQTTSVGAPNNTFPVFVTSAQGSSQMLHAKNDGTNGDPREATETRMTNVAVQFGIRY
jgi:hypothetical protein